MKSSTKSAARSRMALSYQTAQRAVAYEKSRAKPEDASPLAERPTFRNRLADWASRALARFLTFFGYHKPATVTSSGRKKRQKRTTPPRAFGKAGRKLARKVREYGIHHGYHPMIHGAARKQFLKEIGA